MSDDEEPCFEFVVNKEKQTITIEEAISLIKKSPSCDSASPVNFLLIGSRALLYHISSFRRPSDVSWKEKKQREWMNDRKDYIHHSDWDVIALNGDALVEWMKTNEKMVKTLSLNHSIVVKHFQNEVDYGLERSIDDFSEFDYNDSEIMMEWMKKKSDSWNKFSFRFNMVDGEIIEMEYCSHNADLVSYLESCVLKEVNVPNMEGVSLAPLELLDCLKQSHIMVDGDWIEHFKDLQIIKYLQQGSTGFDRMPIHQAFNSNYLLGLFFYDRVLVTAVYTTSYGSVLEQFLTLGFEKNREVRGSLSIVHYSRSVEETYDKKVNSGIKKIYIRETVDLDASENSVKYLANEISKGVVYEVQKHGFDGDLEGMALSQLYSACFSNEETNIFWLLVDNGLKILDWVFKLLSTQDLGTFFHVEEKLEFILNEKLDVVKCEKLVKWESNTGVSLGTYYITTDVLAILFSFIPYRKEVLSCIRVSKEWNRFFTMPSIWKFMYLSRWPIPAHYGEDSAMNYETNWKIELLKRDMVASKSTLKMPPISHLNDIGAIFQNKFESGTIFKQLTHDFYNNCYLHKIDYNDEDEMEKTTAQFTIYWPLSAPIHLTLSVNYDYAGYRKGDSWGGSRDSFSITLSHSKGHVNITDSGLSSLDLRLWNEVDFNDYYNNENQKQTVPLLVVLCLTGLQSYKWYSYMFRCHLKSRIN